MVLNCSQGLNRFVRFRSRATNRATPVKIASHINEESAHNNTKKFKVMFRTLTSSWTNHQLPHFKWKNWIWYSFENMPLCDNKSLVGICEGVQFQIVPVPWHIYLLSLRKVNVYSCQRNSLVSIEVQTTLSDEGHYTKYVD